jgi:hypothetical protein
VIAETQTQTETNGLVINHVFSDFFDGIARLTFSSETFAMVKERVSARELAERITAKIGVAGFAVFVRRDHAYGRQPNVVAAPRDLIGYQRLAGEIANRLRVKFDLRD